MKDGGLTAGDSMLGPSMDFSEKINTMPGVGLGGGATAKSVEFSKSVQFDKSMMSAHEQSVEHLHGSTDVFGAQPTLASATVEQEEAAAAAKLYVQDACLAELSLRNTGATYGDLIMSLLFNR